MNPAGTQTYYDRPEVIGALQYWVDLVNKYKVHPEGIVEWGTTPKDFFEKKVAMIWTTTGNLTNVKNNAKFDFGVAMLPAGKQRGSPTGGGNFYMFEKSTPAQRDAAMRFIKWVTTPQRAAQWGIDTGYVAVRADAWETPAMKAIRRRLPGGGRRARPAAVREGRAVDARQPARHQGAERRPAGRAHRHQDAGGGDEGRAARGGAAAALVQVARFGVAGCHAPFDRTRPDGRAGQPRGGAAVGARRFARSREGSSSFAASTDAPASMSSPSSFGTVGRRGFLAGAAALGAAALYGRAPAVLAQSKAPLKIGLLDSFSTSGAAHGSAILNGMKLYFDRIGGTIAGRRIEIVMEDDESDAKVGLEKLRKLVEQRPVRPDHRPPGEQRRDGRARVSARQQDVLPVQRSRRRRRSYTGVPYLFRCSVSTRAIHATMGEWYGDNVSKDVVTTASDGAEGRSAIREFKAGFLKKGGTVTKEIYPPSGQRDFSRYLADIRSIAPRATYNVYAADDAVRFVRQYDEYGLAWRTRLAGSGFMVEGETLAGAGEERFRRTVVASLRRHARQRGEQAVRRELPRQVRRVPERLQRARLRRRAHRPPRLAGGRRQRAGQGQAARRDAGAQVRRAARPVPLRSRHAEPDPERLRPRGGRARRANHQQGARHVSGRRRAGGQGMSERHRHGRARGRGISWAPIGFE